MENTAPVALSRPEGVSVIKRPLIIMTLFAGLLLVVKIASLVTQTFALAPMAIAAEDAPTKEPAAAEDGNARVETPAPAAADPAMMTEAELALLRDLSKKRDQLAGKERDMDMRERLLEATERRIETKIEELKALEEQVKSRLVDFESQENERVQSVVRVYEKMKPADAARILERLDMPIQLDVAQRMSELRMAPILSAMSAPAAQRLTTALASRQILGEDPGVN